MNKALRHQLKMAAYRRRLKNLRLTDAPELHVYRSHGKPCSCNTCRGTKFRDVRQKVKLELNRLELA